MINQNIILQKHNGLNVVRGDLLVSGIKGLCMSLVMPEIKQNEVVYAAHAYGHSGFALGYAGLEYEKKVTLFYSNKIADTYIQRKTTSLNNVECKIINDVKHQSELHKYVRKYALKNNAYYIPIGFDYSLFTDKLVSLARSVATNPSEVWVAGGSGTTARSLKRAWPNASINVVNLGMMPNADMATKLVHFATEQPEDLAELRPPYPSAPYYDAKSWRFIKKYAKPRALIWNIA